VLLSAAAPLMVSAITASRTGIDDPAVVSLRVLAFVVMLSGLVDAYTLLLNAHSRFAAPGLAAASNALAATALLAAAPHLGLAVLIAGTISGLLLQAAILWWIGRSTGVIVSWRRSSELKDALQAGRSVTPALLFSNIALLIPTTAASHLGEGVVAALSMAMRFHLAVTHAAAIAVSTVLLPRFATAFALGRPGDISSMLRGGLPFAAATGVACVLWVGIAGPDFVRLLLQRGEFDGEAAALVSTAWLWLSVGVFPTVWGTALAKVLQARQLGRQLSALSLIGAIAAAATAAVAATSGSFTLLSAAMAAAMMTTTAGCAWCVNHALRHAGSVDGRIQSGAAAAGCAIAIALVLHLLGPLEVGPWGVLFTTTVLLVFIAVPLLRRRYRRSATEASP
jgi:putative peptidoglycan lipid II flippase